MIEFVENYGKLLPYTKKDYFLFLDEKENKKTWYGISIQYSSNDFNTSEILGFMSDIFRSIINEYDTGENWIISHDDKDMPWFIKGKNTKALDNLKELFKDHEKSETFKGGISLPKSTILGSILNDIICYPYELSYKNIDVSHTVIPLIIKVTGHLTIDVISKDIDLIIVIKTMNFPLNYKIIEYR